MKKPAQPRATYTVQVQWQIAMPKPGTPFCNALLEELARPLPPLRPAAPDPGLTQPTQGDQTKLDQHYTSGFRCHRCGADAPTTYRRFGNLCYDCVCVLEAEAVAEHNARQ
jgi:hypothetical protein